MPMEEKRPGKAPAFVPEKGKEERFVIKKAAFVTSVGARGDYPAEKGCEIALVGRSNVGKSTLINCLCRSGKLAKTSASPGKTRLCNFFLLNDSFYLVDLPGYGFAKAPKEEQVKWGEMMDRYLSCGRVDHLFMLLDIRHEPTEDDRRMLQYLLYYNIPYTLIATKADKIARSKRKQQAVQNARLVGASPYAIPFSGETGEGREEVLWSMGQVVRDAFLRNTEKSAQKIIDQPLTEA